MSCVNPPLLAKPSRGYGWTCAPCSRRHEEEVDKHEGLRQLVPTQPKVVKTNAPAVRGRGRPRKDRQLAEKEEALEVKHFKMWPFRYFGCADRILREAGLTAWLQAVHRCGRHAWSVRPPGGGFGALILLTVDPDDLIFPRAATRVGPKYQAVVPSAPGSDPPPAGKPINLQRRILFISLQV